jgi:uncharacterized DUF497 family protein
MLSLKITSFEWDKGNIAHLLEHDVDPEEVEEAFAPENLFHIVKGKGRYYCFGKTMAGRYLHIVFEYKGRGLARPITAWEMTEKEKRKFKKWRK